MKKKRQDVERNRKTSLYFYMGIVMAVCLYAGLHLGAVYRQMEQPGLLGALAKFGNHMVEHPFSLFPSDWLMTGIFLAVGIMVDLGLYNEYLRVSESVQNAHGDAAFETELRQYSLEFVLNPRRVMAVTGGKVTDRTAPYNEEHKRVLRRYPGDRKSVV